MKNYTHITLSQRYQIQALLQAGVSQTDIAKQLGFHRSSISRELNRSVALRGRSFGKYIAENAERKSQKRHKYKFKRVLLTTEVKDVIYAKMKRDKWSPELVSAKCFQLGIPKVSHETIYKWIWESKHTNTKENRQYKDLHKELKHGKQRQKRGNIKDNRGGIVNRVHIRHRPAIVEHRKKLGT